MFSSFIYTLSLHDALPILPSSIHPEALGRRQKHSRGMMVDGERRLSSSEFLRSAAFLGRKTGTIACTAVRSAGPRKVLFAHGFWAVPVDTLLAALYSQDSQTLLMRLTKIQVGQLWKKDASGDIYLVTRLYSEALHTMAVLRKSGAEGEAQVRVRVERGSKGQTLQGFSPAQEEESY